MRKKTAMSKYNMKTCELVSKPKRTYNSLKIEVNFNCTQIDIVSIAEITMFLGGQT